MVYCRSSGLCFAVLCVTCHFYLSHGIDPFYTIPPDEVWTRASGYTDDFFIWVKSEIAPDECDISQPTTTTTVQPTTTTTAQPTTTTTDQPTTTTTVQPTTTTIVQNTTTTTVQNTTTTTVQPTATTTVQPTTTTTAQPTTTTSVQPATTTTVPPATTITCEDVQNAQWDPLRSGTLQLWEGNGTNLTMVQRQYDPYCVGLGCQNVSSSPSCSTTPHDNSSWVFDKSISFPMPQELIWEHPWDIRPLRYSEQCYISHGWKYMGRDEDVFENFNPNSQDPPPPNIIII